MYSKIARQLLTVTIGEVCSRRSVVEVGELSRRRSVRRPFMSRHKQTARSDIWRRRAINV